jgi:ABC-type amino acid transport substrate-binding protein
MTGKAMRAQMVAGALATLGFMVIALPAAAEESLLQKMKQSGMIKACIAQTNPESFKDAKTGEWKGINVDLMNELATWARPRSNGSR